MTRYECEKLPRGSLVIAKSQATSFTIGKIYITGGKHYDKYPHLICVVADDDGVANGLGSAVFDHISCPALGILMGVSDD